MSWVSTLFDVMTTGSSTIGTAIKETPELGTPIDPEALWKAATPQAQIDSYYRAKRVLTGFGILGGVAVLPALYALAGSVEKRGKKKKRGYAFKYRPEAQTQMEKASDNVTQIAKGMLVNPIFAAPIAYLLAESFSDWPRATYSKDTGELITSRGLITDGMDDLMQTMISGMAAAAIIGSVTK